MLPNRFRISKSATDTLKLLKARTGVTPNIVCRVALMISLEGGAGGGKNKPDLEGSEFNTPTLFGEHALLYECFLRFVHGNLDARGFHLAVASHIDDGLERVKRCKTFFELAELLSSLAIVPEATSG